MKKRPLELSPTQKIRVFISSKCDNSSDVPKYDPIRAELKELIESTQFATVYTFEGESASTLSAESHYTYALEDCDVCIFLIDNADGVPSGVQKEIDVVRKKDIMALYYFCDETTKEKTELEKSLMGASFAKSKTVHHFSELSTNSAAALIDDIALIYHNYCRKRLLETVSDSAEKPAGIDMKSPEDHREIVFPKIILQNIDKCTQYILKFSADYSFFHNPDEDYHTSDLDDWGCQFLHILFEGQSIKSFNASMFMDVLKGLQPGDFYNVVSIRWKAIQSYLCDNIAECISNLNSALELARETNQATWLINDILIDLRNQQWDGFSNIGFQNAMNVQKELDDNKNEFFYPVLDRINDSIQEAYLHGLFKKKIQSPNTVEYGSNLEYLGKLLASAYIIAIYNGSLTHIILFFEKIKDFLFYLSSRYDDWTYKLSLLKFSFYCSDSKEPQGIIDAYPEILSKLSSDDAEAILIFCNFHPIKHIRQSKKILAFGKLGYYLSDNCFKKYENEILEEITQWLNDDNPNYNYGNYIFRSLSDVSHRLSKDKMSEICCSLIDKQYVHYYDEMFRFIANGGVDLNTLKRESAEALVQHIVTVFNSEKGFEMIKCSGSFLSVLRNQNRELTEPLDKQISEKLPNYYNFEYKLNTTNNKKDDYPYFLEKLIEIVRTNNETQGVNGVFRGYGFRYISIMRSILLETDLSISTETMDRLITTVIDTLVNSREPVYIKVDAVLLLCTIVIKYPADYLRNQSAFQSIADREGDIEANRSSGLFSNINSLALNICIKLLMSAMGKDTHTDLMDLLPYIRDNRATTISVSDFIANYLDISDEFNTPKSIETVLLNNALELSLMDNTEICWSATRVLLSLSKSEENQDVICRRLLSLIESENVYIKNLILRKTSRMNTIPDEMRKRFFEICKNDANYVTRKVCEEFGYSD